MPASLYATLKNSWLRKTCIILGILTMLAVGGIIFLLLLTPPSELQVKLVTSSIAGLLLGLLIAVLGLLATIFLHTQTAQERTNAPQTDSAIALQPQDTFSDPQRVTTNGTATMRHFAPLENPISQQREAPPDTIGQPLAMDQPEERGDVPEITNAPGVKMRVFLLPKEGNDPERAADKYAYNTNTPQYRYAVTDGVSTSFLPASWARIIATQFVAQDIVTTAAFVQWLIACSNSWHRWVRDIWVPQTNKKIGKEKDWERDIERGAQTTLIGCSFAYPPLSLDGSTTVELFAVGDANFFLLHPISEAQESWQYWAFPHQKYDDFGSTTDTLATSLQAIEETAMRVKRDPARRIALGDYLLLTTDALAQWILLQLQRNENPWTKLLTLSDNQAFHAFIETERANGNIEIDDTTLMIIYLGY